MNERVVMKNNTRIKGNPKESGQSMVELAVSIVMLLILLAGVVDLGRITFYYIAMRDAAQEAASYASIFPYNNFEILERGKAGAVDESRIEVVMTINPGATGAYSCASDEGCATSTNSCTAHTVAGSDVIEITITDNAFPITMPILGTFLGRQNIVLETTIQDVVLRVPECP